MVKKCSKDQTDKEDVTQRHIKNILAGWLGEQGLIIVEEKSRASLHLRAIVQTVGTRRGIRFVGLPSSQAPFLPLRLPELAYGNVTGERGTSVFTWMSLNPALVGLFEQPTHTLVPYLKPNIPRSFSIDGRNRMSTTPLNCSDIPITVWF